MVLAASPDILAALAALAGAARLLAEFALVLLLVDLASGIGHWLEDTYGSPDTPVLGPLFIVPNLEHHRRPRAFLAKGWLESCGDLMLAGALLVAAAWALDLLTWHVVAFAAIGSQANQIHKWAHQNRQEKGALVDLLQRLRLVQGPRGHGRHHHGAKDSDYCTVTDWLNPWLERAQAWRRLERALERAFGLRRRVEPASVPVTPRPAAASPAARSPRPASAHR